VAPFQFLTGQWRKLGIPDPGDACRAFTKRDTLAEFTAANGREFIADDVYSTITVCWGSADTQSQPKPREVYFTELISVSALDRYTVEFRWESTKPGVHYEALHGVMQRQCIENPEAVKKVGRPGRLAHAVGTGPFI